jgi:hypothetical protein
MSLAPCFVLIKTDFTQAIFKLYGAQDDLDLLILMCLFPKGWDYRPATIPSRETIYCSINTGSGPDLNKVQLAEPAASL